MEVELLALFSKSPHGASKPRNLRKYAKNQKLYFVVLSNYDNVPNLMAESGCHRRQNLLDLPRRNNQCMGLLLPMIFETTRVDRYCDSV